MRSAFALLELAAASESTVLIEGESGTGKEGAAIAVHEASRRRNGPFVTVDCGAIPSYEESRRQAIASWERRYLDLLLAAHGGHVEQAARASGVARAHLYRLVAKHGLLANRRR